MTTYYSFQTWSMGGQGDCHVLYETFDDACDAIEEEIKLCGNYDDFQKNKPNREEKFKELEKSDIVTYWVLGDQLCIAKMKVVPKKPKYVYRYSVLCTPTPNRNSQLYDSFDEMYDAANKELTELYKTIGKDWNDPETQEESRKNWRWDTTKEGCRKTLEETRSVLYAHFIDPNGGIKTDTLVVNCGVRCDRFYLDKVAV